MKSIKLVRYQMAKGMFHFNDSALNVESNTKLVATFVRCKGKVSLK